MRRRAATIRTVSLPAPTAGWVTNENVARSRSNSARVMDNWFPEADSVRVRGGLQKTATLNADVEAMFAYRSGGSEKLFAADSSRIYDVTAPASTTTPPTPDVSSQTGGDYSAQQMTVAGGTYLYAVNGEDNPQLYDGTSWQAVTGASTPIALTGTVTLSDLSFVFAFKERLFFIEKNTLSLWYLSTGTVGGMLTEFPLTGIINEGGSLIAGGSWSADSGEGLDDRLWLLSNQGEVAVYEGDDPGSNFSLAGVYRVGVPLGAQAIIRAGGDPVFATDAGMVPLSAAVSLDEAVLSDAAVTRAIETEWRQEVQQRTGLSWLARKWDAGGLALVAMPVATPSSTSPAQCFVVNMETGAWCRYTGWNVRCAETRGDNLYVAIDEKVYLAESTGYDDEATYTAQLQFQAQQLRMAGIDKAAKAMRASFLAGNNISPKLSVATNYRKTFPAAPNAASQSGAPVWGSAIWGTAVFGGGQLDYKETGWKSVAGVGRAHAPQVQITCGDTAETNARLVDVTLTYEPHGVMT